MRTKLYSPCRTLPNILSFALNSSPIDIPMYLALTTSVLQSSTYISCLLYSLLSTSHTPHLLTTLDLATSHCSRQSAAFLDLHLLPSTFSELHHSSSSDPLLLPPHTSSQDHDSFLQSSTYISYLLHSSLSTPPHYPIHLVYTTIVCRSPRPTSPVGKQSCRRWRPLAIHRMPGKCE